MPAPVRKPRPQFDRPASADTGRGPALRLLPFVIIAALSLLGFRIQLVVSDMASKSGPILALGQTAFAQAQPAPATEEPAPEDAEDAADMADGAEASADGEASTEEDAAAATQPVAFNPSDLTKSEIDTLQRLSERRTIIEQRERELLQKESLVKAAEQRLDQKIGQMQEAEKQLQALVQQYDEKKKAEIEQLVRIYTAMKPKDAARIFDELDMTILVPVMTTMKEAKAAPILALMTGEKARAVTEELSTRRQLPGEEG